MSTRTRSGAPRAYRPRAPAHDARRVTKPPRQPTMPSVRPARWRLANACMPWRCPPGSFLHRADAQVRSRHASLSSASHIRRDQGTHDSVAMRSGFLTALSSSREALVPSSSIPPVFTGTAALYDVETDRIPPMRESVPPPDSRVPRQPATGLAPRKRGRDPNAIMPPQRSGRTRSRRGSRRRRTGGSS